MGNVLIKAIRKNLKIKYKPKFVIFFYCFNTVLSKRPLIVLFFLTTYL